MPRGARCHDAGCRCRMPDAALVGWSYARGVVCRHARGRDVARGAAFPRICGSRAWAVGRVADGGVKGLRRWVDPFVLLLVAALTAGLLLPVAEAARGPLDVTARAGIALLFFTYGLRLPTREVRAGLRNVTLQGTILAVTFVLWPLVGDRKSTRLNSSHVAISYAVFCLKKKTTKNYNTRSIESNI